MKKWRNKVLRMGSTRRVAKADDIVIGAEQMTEVREEV